jgi:hypothetical protein
VRVGPEPQLDGTLALVEISLPLDGPAPILAARRRGLPILQALAALVVVLAVGNLGLLAVTLGARLVVEQPAMASVAGVGSLRTVDATVLRGANPTHTGYEGLRDAGVVTVVDLRAETNAHDDDEFIRSLGMKVVHLPIRDGQTPSDEQQAAFMELVSTSPGRVFLHCGAGVGRTGAIAARYLVETGQRSPLSALAHNLEVGPPSIEQDAYSLGIDLGPVHPLLVTTSRFFDAPRRILHYL